jgi:uncharacterized protein (TIGR02452 family)
MMSTENDRGPDSTDWAIYSPDVPIFRTDDGTELDQPWLLSFITCAAPYAPTIGQPESGDLLQRWIHRVLSIAKVFGYSGLVLGAWGCGVFGNGTCPDSRRFAASSQDRVSRRIFLGPFRDVSLSRSKLSQNEKETHRRS